MPPRRKSGYNWKARQSGAPRRGVKTRGIISAQVTCVEDGDSNALVLPPKKPRVAAAAAGDGGGRAAGRKKLSSRQRKHLQKVVEAKEKKAKRAALLESLSALTLPSSQLRLLQPSTELGRTRSSNQRQPPASSSSSSLHATTWRPQQRKRKKRRLLKAEKVLYDPRSKSSSSGSTLPNDEGVSTISDSSEGGSEASFHSDGDEDTHTTTPEAPLCCEADPPSSHKGRGKEAGQAVGRSQGEASDQVEPRVPNTTHPVVTGHSDTLATSAVVAKPRPVVFKQLPRPPDVQAARLSLPILSEEQTVMEAVRESSVVVLCGETGSGKTTQVPQFLYEAGLTSSGHGDVIGVTEPRRVAAVSMSKRVASEMGLSARQVSYQIRYEGNVSDDTVIKFMTDGVLLKEVEKDFLLSRYCALVIDEAHERSVFTDILVGLLSRIVPLREKNGNPLKLIIMSATLRVEDFTENKLLFPSPPPLIKIESRQYPVTVHFNKRTPSDYLNEAFRKACKIHRTLKAGNILVFVTGQSEVKTLCRRLRRTFPLSSSSRGAAEGEEGEEGGTERRAKGRRVSGASQRKGRIDLDSYPILPWDKDEEEVGGEDHAPSSFPLSDDDSGDDDRMEWGQSSASTHPMLVLPLYSLLPSDQQSRVFEASPEGVRVCVVATNVAETSLTIPGTKYVVDTGLVKMRFYDKTTGVSTFRVVWTSKASANQRAGRAGRTEPGHCYRLFSSAVFQNEFEQFSSPEITRRPVEDLALQMKAMNIDKVVNFPFPTPPSVTALQSAEELLVKLGALEATTGASPRSKPAGGAPVVITPLGRTMAQFPVAPRYGKMLSLSHQHGCLPYTIAIVAALSVKEIFVSSESTGHHKAWAGKGEGQLLGDVMVLLRAVGACEYAPSRSEEFCLQSGLRWKAVQEVRKLRRQLTNTVNAISPESEVTFDPGLAPPTAEQTRYLRQIVLAGLGDHVARKVPTDGLSVEERRRLRHAYHSSLCVAPVHLPPSSSLLHAQPQFVVFQEIVETTKLYMRVVSAVEEEWLPLIVPEFCSFSAPLQTPPPFFDVATGTVKCYRSCTYGNLCWPIPAQVLPHPDDIDKYKLFAVFLLQGKVVPRLAEFSPYLLLAPITMMKTWSKLHRQCEALLNALVGREVCSRDRLVATWKEEEEEASKYLLKAYSMWLPESRHKHLAKQWPPL